MDLSQFSTEDLKAMQVGDLSKVSTAGLKAMQGLQTSVAETYNPTAGSSFGQNVLEGTGRGMASVARGAAGIEAPSFLSAVAPGIGAGMEAAKRLGRAVTDYVGVDSEEAKKIDAPLLATAGGKIGNVIGNAAAAAPLVLVPGANTALGAAAAGAAFGGATTEGGAAERLHGAAFGAAGGAGGVGLGKVLGVAANRLSSAGATAQAANAGRDAAAVAAQKAGYVLPPTEVNPSLLNSALEGFSGKVKTSQKASARNQTVSNDLAKNELGLPADQPLSVDALKALRTNAGQAYDAVASAGTIKTQPSYDAALDAIVAPYIKAAQGFPGAKLNPIVGEIESLRSPVFDAGSAVAKIKELRANADAAYASGNKDLGKALKGGADAIEGAIDTHLATSGAPPDLLQNLRDARQLIAKTYSVEKAINPTTGDVSASVLAGQLKRGKPLSGELRTIAEAGQAFPKATQTLQQNYNAVSPLDYLAGGAGLGTGNPLLALGVAARPMVRSALLSSPVQGRLAAPSYGPNALLELLKNNRALPIAGIAPANQ